MLFDLLTRSGIVRSVGRHSISIVSLLGLQSLLKMQTTMEQGGDVQDARTLKYPFQRNTFASAAKSAPPTSTDILLRIRVENSVDALENVLTHVTFLAIQAHALHVAVLVLSSPAIAATKPSSYAVLIPTFRSKQESHAIESVENCWDAENTLARLYVILDSAHLAENCWSKSATVANMSGRDVAAMENQRRHWSTVNYEQDTINAMKSVIVH